MIARQCISFVAKFAGSPEYARVAPFAIFVVLTALQGQLGEDSRYWLYLLKTLVGAWLIWEMRPFVEEMRWKISWEAVVVGVAVFAIWVGLDGLYPRLSEPGAGWNPGTAVRRRFGPRLAVRGGAHRAARPSSCRRWRKSSTAPSSTGCS